VPSFNKISTFWTPSWNATKPRREAMTVSVPLTDIQLGQGGTRVNNVLDSSNANNISLKNHIVIRQEDHILQNNTPLVTDM